jgi:flagellar motor switch protein FliN/FliY
MRDVLQLGPGSIVQLDKVADAPVELYVNDKLIARGEVVVVDDRFGIKVTDIVAAASPAPAATPAPATPAAKAA